eukprot:g4228.t1
MVEIIAHIGSPAREDNSRQKPGRGKFKFVTRVRVGVLTGKSPKRGREGGESGEAPERLRCDEYRQALFSLRVLGVERCEAAPANMAEQKQSQGPGGDKSEALCTVEPSTRGPGGAGGAVADPSGASDNRRSMDVFSDPYLGAVMLVLLLLHLLQHSMRDPCTC